MNKKLFALLMMAGIGFSANAQQLPNGTFDDDFVDCFPWEKGSNGTTAYGTQPEGWCVSNVPNSLAKAMAKQVAGVNGDNDVNDKAVMLTNTAAMGNGIPAYLTLGTAWATAETKMTSTRNTDGGVFGGIDFTYRPDAVSLWYKRDLPRNNKGNVTGGDKDISTVVAYLWKGTWKQANVPSNTAVGVLGYGSAEKVTMTDRDANILGTTWLTGGDVTKTDDAALIASAMQQITGVVSEWTELEVPLDYKLTDAVPQKLNIVISAAGYQDEGGTRTEGVNITVDDVKMVYWNTLASLSYNGNEILEADKTEYVCDEEFDPELLEFAARSQFAEVKVDYDKETALCTITVSREGAEKDMVYTIQFQCWNTLTSLSYDGMNFLSNLISDETDFEYDEEFDEEKLEYVTKSQSAFVTVGYDNETALCTVTVTREGAENKVYTIQFKKPEPEPDPELVNDVTMDGKVDAEDVAAIVRLVLNTQTEDDDWNLEAADVNGDGEITIADVTALIDKLIGNTDSNNE